jgi:hypothetical protein
VVGVGLIVLAFPALAAYGRDEIPNEPSEYVMEG